MRTVRCSGRPWGVSACQGVGVCPGGVSACQRVGGVCLTGVSAQEGCLPRGSACQGVSAQRGVSAQGGCLPEDGKNFLIDNFFKAIFESVRSSCSSYTVFCTCVTAHKGDVCRGGENWRHSGAKERHGKVRWGILRVHPEKWAWTRRRWGGGGLLQLWNFNAAGKISDTVEKSTI